MKINCIIFGLLFILAGMMFACKRDAEKPENVPFAQVLVFNGVVGAGNLKVSLSPQDKYWSTISDKVLLNSKSSMLLMAPVGMNVLKATKFVDTTNTVYKNRVSLKENNFYSLYLTGTASGVDTLFRKEDKIPPYVPVDIRKKRTAQDSIINIRFANLSYNGPKLSIKVLNSNENVVSNLGYQEFSDFKAYNGTLGDIKFEIRDAGNQNILFSLPLSIGYFLQFKTIELVIVGSYGGNVPYSDSYGIGFNKFL